jgi:uncharacterized membrane protein
MKIAALLAAIALTVNGLVDIVNFVMSYSRFTARTIPTYLAAQVFWLFAQGCMIVFFFAFYSRARD